MKNFEEILQEIKNLFDEPNKEYNKAIISNTIGYFDKDTGIITIGRTKNNG